MLSINFEQSDYYTIDEAARYLNLKHNLNNITPNKLLRKLSNFKTPLYAHGMGFSLFGNYETNILISSNDDIESINLFNKVKKETDKILSTMSDNGLLFLQLHPLLIELLSTGIAVKSNRDIAEDALFVSALVTHKLAENSENLAFINEIIERKFDCNIIKILTLVPRLRVRFCHDYQRIKPKATIPYLNCPEEYDSSFLDSDNLVINFEINIDNVLILHNDLMKFESDFIGNFTPETEGFEKHYSKNHTPRKGVSSRKLEAKRTAWLLAKVLWEEEPYNNTRITEMALKVYTILNASDLKDQSPEQFSSIKGWISDAAPSIASRAGRPSKKE